MFFDTPIIVGILLLIIVFIVFYHKCNCSSVEGFEENAPLLPTNSINKAFTLDNNLSIDQIQPLQIPTFPPINNNNTSSPIQLKMPTTVPTQSYTTTTTQIPYESDVSTTNTLDLALEPTMKPSTEPTMMPTMEPIKIEKEEPVNLPEYNNEELMDALLNNISVCFGSDPQHLNTKQLNNFNIDFLLNNMEQIKDGIRERTVENIKIKYQGLHEKLRKNYRDYPDEYRFKNYRIYSDIMTELRCVYLFIQKIKDTLESYEPTQMIKEESFEDVKDKVFEPQTVMTEIKSLANLYLPIHNPNGDITKFAQELYDIVYDLHNDGHEEPLQQTTTQPTIVPTTQPTMVPTTQPTIVPTTQPTLFAKSVMENDLSLISESDIKDAMTPQPTQTTISDTTPTITTLGSTNNDPITTTIPTSQPTPTTLTSYPTPTLEPRMTMAGLASEPTPTLDMNRNNTPMPTSMNNGVNIDIIADDEGIHAYSSDTLPGSSVPLSLPSSSELNDQYQYNGKMINPELLIGDGIRLIDSTGPNNFFQPNIYIEH